MLKEAQSKELVLKNWYKPNQSFFERAKKYDYVFDILQGDMEDEVDICGEEIKMVEERETLVNYVKDYGNGV